MRWKLAGGTARGVVFRLLLVAGVLTMGAAACTVAPEEDETASGVTLQRLEEIDEERAWTLFQWYIEQGLAPCDPPPDPWHPFVQYGFCAADIQPEAVPNESYDE